MQISKYNTVAALCLIVIRYVVSTARISSDFFETSFLRLIFLVIHLIVYGISRKSGPIFYVAILRRAIAVSFTRHNDKEKKIHNDPVYTILTRNRSIEMRHRAVCSHLSNPEPLFCKWR